MTSTRPGGKKLPKRSREEPARAVPSTKPEEKEQPEPRPAYRWLWPRRRVKR